MGIVKQLHALFAKHSEQYPTRKEMVKFAIGRGYNRNTVSRQYGEWSKQSAVSSYVATPVTSMRTAIEQYITEAVRVAAELKMIVSPQKFKRMLVISHRSPKVSRGGIRDGKPYVCVAQRYEKMNAKTWIAYYGKFDLARIKSGFKATVAAAKVGDLVVPEYSAIYKDSEIGCLRVNDYESIIKVIVLHEVAHAITYWNEKETVKRFSKPHGKIWQDNYRKLRRAYGLVR